MNGLFRFTDSNFSEKFVDFRIDDGNVDIVMADKAAMMGTNAFKIMKAILRSLAIVNEGDVALKNRERENWDKGDKKEKDEAREDHTSLAEVDDGAERTVFTTFVPVRSTLLDRRAFPLFNKLL
jgi:hypothetical protein